MARPTKLTPEVQQRICDAIRAGNYIETAVAFADIDRATLHNWLRRGAKEAKGLYHEFARAMEKAQADAEARDVALIAKAAADGVWQASAWRLERKYPDRWGRKERLDATVRGAVSHVDLGPIDLRRLSQEELDALETLYEKILTPAGAAARDGAPPGAGRKGAP